MADHTAETYADLADAIMSVARDLRAHAYHDPNITRLNFTEVTVMRHVERHPGTSPSEVAEATGMQRSNVSAALRSLEAKGFVERAVDEADNRQAVLRATARSARNLEVLRASWARLIADRFAAVGTGPAGPSAAISADVAAALRVLDQLDAGREARSAH